MTLSTITKKLFKNNKNQYILLSGSLIFAVAIVTAFGILLYSPTVTNVLVDGGSSMQLATSCFALLIIGTIIFCGYIFSLFIKYKSKEIGIFMSLGIAKRNVKKILLKELSYLLPIVIVVGLILALPISYLSWELFTLLIIKTPETVYTIGWAGYILGIVFSIVIVLLINFMLSRYLKKVDIMKILKAEESIEEVKGGNLFLGILGVILIPVGISLIGISALFAVLPLLGIYLVAVQVPYFGDFVKKFSINSYNKNIMFYNMLKLKGKQYTQTTFITTILIAIVIFALCFSIGQFASSQVAIKNSANDFRLKHRADLDVISEEYIKEKANEFNVGLKDYEEFTTILLLADGMTEDEEGNEIYAEYCLDFYFMNEKDFNKLTGKNIDIKPGHYSRISEYEMNGYEFIPQELKLTNADTKEQKLYIEQEPVLGNDIMIRYDVFVLDSKDYESNFKTLDDKHKDKYIRFNVDNWEESYDFAKDLRGYIIKNSTEEVAVDRLDATFANEFSNRPSPFEKLEMDEDSAELYRWWKYNPMFKILEYNDSVMQYAIYVLLFVFIALLGFISASMIFYVKSLSSVWDDKRTYQSITFLGAKEGYIKKCITKLTLILFGLPTILGSVAAYSFIMLIMGEMKGSLGYALMLQFSLIIVAIFLIIQLIVFLITRKIVVKQILDFDTI